ncbi:hypothetical protein J8A01_23355 [Vibrio parahaemolyticus]|uniref:hypothetical protein n=1 Tax=Vibrio parahaemolyticus TaxID=670 RepID=UPI0013758531|nr:hypothetical protein [Vibrio parahaemolyticus]MCF9126299.1 hypothetical protein [Vibrio parahaemolyticus]NCM80987.1 hypothetical protein [Vibrio parahaemolyticus]
MKYLDDYSNWGNSVLYAMCSERPKHNDIDTIVSKLWIIGRAYSASIERKAGKEFDIKDAAKLLAKSEIDLHIERLQDIERPTHENISVVLSAHKYLTDLLNEATGIDKRSLASKYLHFHAPKAVFIYDSIANRNIRHRLRGKRFNYSKQYDDQYSSFCYKCLHYRDEVMEKTLLGLVSPRRLDMDLLQYTAL